MQLLIIFLSCKLTTLVIKLCWVLYRNSQIQFFKVIYYYTCKW